MSENRFPPGLEIMGWDKLEPSKYIERKQEKNKMCPFKNDHCGGSKCGLWNDSKRRCGLIR